MRRDNLKRIGLVILIIAGISFVVFTYYKRSNYLNVDEGLSTPSQTVLANKVVINNQGIFVEIANTPELMARGLSGRSSIADDHGMLFVLRPDRYTSFWMKGMLIPIDIIWINDDKIVQIDINVLPSAPGTPDSALELIKPKVPVDYVLEVGANVSTKMGLGVGDVVDLTQAKL